MTDILQLASLEPTAVSKQDGAYLIEARGRFKPTRCPECRASTLHGHGTQQQTFRDTPLHGLTVRIVVKRRRYRCQDCGKTQFAPLPDLDSKRFATTRLIHYIRKHCFRETFAAIARRVGMDEKTIRHVFDDYVEKLQNSIRYPTLRVMGIDELKIIGAYRAIITNVERKTVFDMRETRRKADLLCYFKALPDRDRIEWVTMDMYHVYRQVVRETLPQARIIVDRFHIQRMANKVLETVRKRCRAALEKKQRLKLKDERFLLLKRQHDLSPDHIRKLLAWFEQFPELGMAHALKEGFLGIWDQQDRPSAEAAYQRWLNHITPELQPAFKILTRAMANWHEEIFAYFENPITNAYTESMNNIAKGMNRMGRGYSFGVIRARMLYDEKSRKDGAVVETTLVEDDSFDPDTMCYKTTFSDKKRKTEVRRAVEYGPHIPTLSRLLEEGYFEN